MLKFKDEVLFFIGGAAVAFWGKKILKHPNTRKACVNTLASSLNLYDEAKVSVQNMREEAEDIFVDAKNSKVVDEIYRDAQKSDTKE